MNHPTEHEWMEFLYRETSGARSRELRNHLAACPDCRDKHAAYRASMRALDSWKIERGNGIDFSRLPFVRWAAAAAILLATALAGGAAGARLAQTEARVQAAVDKALGQAREALRAELASRAEDLSNQSSGELAAASKRQIEQLGLTLAAAREADKKAVLAAIEELEQRRAVDYRKLREDLEKVALFTDESLRTAQRQLVRLAAYSLPEK